MCSRKWLVDSDARTLDSDTNYIDDRVYIAYRPAIAIYKVVPRGHFFYNSRLCPARRSQVNPSEVPCLSAAFLAGVRTYSRLNRRSPARERQLPRRHRAPLVRDAHHHLHDGDAGGGADRSPGGHPRRRQNHSPSPSQTPRRRTRRTPSACGRYNRLETQQAVEVSCAHAWTSESLAYSLKTSGPSLRYRQRPPSRQRAAGSAVLHAGGADRFPRCSRLHPPRQVGCRGR